LIDSKQVKRAVVDETVAMEIYFKGSCHKINDIVKTITVSSHDVTDTCLPISLTPPLHLDRNDLNFHVLCTDLAGKRSLLRIVEVFAGNDDTATFAPGQSYILALKSLIPFKVNIPGVSYQYRPKCIYETDICDPTVSVVSKCRERPVIPDDDIDENGFVEAIRRVYVILPGQSIHSCVNNGVCCPYINTTSAGICKFYNRSITHTNPWAHNHGGDHHNGHGSHGHHDDGDNDHDDHHHGHSNGHHDDGDNDHDDHHHHNGEHHHGKEDQQNKKEDEQKKTDDIDNNNNEDEKDETKKQTESVEDVKKIELHEIAKGIKEIALGDANANAQN